MEKLVEEYHLSTSPLEVASTPTSPVATSSTAEKIVFTRQVLSIYWEENKVKICLAAVLIIAFVLARLGLRTPQGKVFSEKVAQSKVGKWVTEQMTSLSSTALGRSLIKTLVRSGQGYVLGMGLQALVLALIIAKKWVGDPAFEFIRDSLGEILPKSTTEAVNLGINNVLQYGTVDDYRRFSDEWSDRIVTGGAAGGALWGVIESALDEHGKQDQNDEGATPAEPKIVQTVEPSYGQLVGSSDGTTDAGREALRKRIEAGAKLLTGQ